MRTPKILFLAIALGNSLASEAQQVTVSGTGATTAVSLVGARTLVNITAGSAITVSRRSSADTLKNIFYTVVGGGGGGAFGAFGGGGGGGVAFNHTGGTNFVGNPSSISVGTGGTAGVSGVTAGGNGNPSSITLSPTTVEATGGRGGSSTSPSSPNPGGGNSGTPTGSGSLTVNIGGLNTKSGNGLGGGGGGGAGITVGVDGISASAGGGTGTGGVGAAGRQITNILSSGNITYGGGGGGSATTTAGAGGAGGGGGASNTASAAVAGSPNTGGGGGSGTTTAGAGGSGVVVISFDAWDIYDDVQVSNKWIYANGTGLGTGSRTAGLPIKIFPNGANTISVTSAFINDVNADVYIEGAALNIGAGGSIVCRHLYVNGGGTITTSSTGSLTCKTVFYSGNATLPSTGFNVAKLYCQGTASAVVQLSSNLSVTKLFIQSGVKLKLNGKNLTIDTIDNTWRTNTGTGVIVGDTGSILTYNGIAPNSTLYMDQTTLGTTNVVRRLILGASARLSLGNAIVVCGKRQTTNTEKGAVELGASSTLSSNTDKTLTAYLQLRYNRIWDEHATISGINKTATSAVLNGEVLYEDFFEAGYRAYRQTGFVTINTTDSTNGMSLIQLTDDLDLYGVKGSTGSGGRGNNADALLEPDGSTTKPSVFTYNETRPNSVTSSWIPYTFTTGTPNYVNQAQGLLIFMRPKNSGASGNYNSALFNTEGRIIPGGLSSDFTYALNSATLTGTTGFNLVANPYASHLDLNLFFSNNSNITNGFYKYNKASKNYVAFSRSGSGNPFNNGTYGDVEVVEPGDAFFVQQQSSPSTVKFSYDYTLDNTYVSSTSFKHKRQGNSLNKLELDSLSETYLGLLLGELADSTKRDDLSIATINNGGDLSYDYKKGDMVNIPNCLDINSYNNDGTLTTIKYFDNEKNWVVPLVVSICNLGRHFLQVKLDYNKPGEETQFILTDNYTNKTMTLTNSLKYEFDITNEAASKGQGRFFLNLISSKLSNGEEISVGELTISPNPVSSEEVVYISNLSRDSELNVYDGCGKKLFEVENQLGDSTFEFDLSKYSLKSGMYFIGPAGGKLKKIIITE